MRPGVPRIAGGKTHHGETQVGRPQEKEKGQEEQSVRQEEDRWVEEEGRHQQAARQEWAAYETDTQTPVASPLGSWQHCYDYCYITPVTFFRNIFLFMEVNG